MKKKIDVGDKVQIICDTRKGWVGQVVSVNSSFVDVDFFDNAPIPYSFYHSSVKLVTWKLVWLYNLSKNYL